ncbi:MAG: enoyl-CoA hydratase/isomerase family protein [Streptosporangiales bacterium]|nr:enoyl-CoA hydratase/isomerase family protein [Streptosporangiales bacterium]
MAEGLRLSQPDDGVVRATIDRGEENLLTGQICDELAAFLREPPSDAHVLVLAPRGPNFCLGRERRAKTVAQLREEVGALVALNRALRTTRLVTVAQVTGGAAGYGVGLAALCDVAVAAPSARFWFPEVDIGLAPAVVLAWLPRLVGSKQAFLLTASGRKISAVQAAEIGLVTMVAPADDALEQTVRDEVAALRKHSSRVHGEIKAFLRAGEDLSEDQTYDLAVEKLILASVERTA